MEAQQGDIRWLELKDAAKAYWGNGKVERGTPERKGDVGFKETGAFVAKVVIYNRGRGDGGLVGGEDGDGN